MAITEEPQYNTASFKRTVSAFEKEYNCKVELKTLKFSTYNQQVAQAKSTGNFSDSERDTNAFVANNVSPVISNGADISKTVADYTDKIENCIKFTLKQLYNFGRPRFFLP